MKLKFKHKPLYTLMVICVGLLWGGLVTSCREDIEPEGPIKEISNLSVTKEGSSAIFSWTSPDDPRITGYIVQLSSSSSFSTFIINEELEPGVSEFTFTNLESEVLYFARVRAKNEYPLHNSPWAEIAFTSNVIENIFTRVTSAQIGPDWVELKWNQPQEGSVTKIKITQEGSASVENAINQDEIAARSKRIEGLQALTNYTAEIYDNDILRGFVSFTTRTEDESITINSVGYETLGAAIAAANSGDVIRMKTGTYDYGSTSFTINGKSITIEAYDADAEPVITLLNFQLRGEIDHFRTKGLKIISTSTNASTDYEKHIIGVTWVTSEINIDLIGCDFSGAESGMIFSQGVNAGSLPEPAPASAIINLTIDNCLLHDFGNAGGDFIDFRSGNIRTIHVKNTSAWKSGRSFFRLDQTNDGVNITDDHMIKFESCTFDQISNGGNLIRSRATSANVVIENCIITNKVSNHANDLRNGSSLNISGLAYFGTNADRIISNAASVSGETLTDPQYADAANGNFTLGNAAVKSAGLGDPRWLQ